jgi:predicted GH43/DUF377 family glycosyl hydrolase
MYWGDQQIWLASSIDLIHWTPVERQDAGEPVKKGSDPVLARLLVVIPTRPGKFDSDLVEPGPPALLTSAGILLCFNGRNSASSGDPGFPEGCYAGSQALMDPGDPGHLLQRLDRCFIRPDKDYEIRGQVNQVCFLEGLIRFRSRWFLYYGTADSRIAVAVKE